MSHVSNSAQENLMSFVEGELEMAGDFLEDATVYLQLCQFLSAVESLQNASRATDIAERYLSQITEADILLRCQFSVNTARKRVHTLEQLIPN